MHEDDDDDGFSANMDDPEVDSTDDSTVVDDFHQELKNDASRQKALDKRKSKEDDTKLFRTTRLPGGKWSTRLQSNAIDVKKGIKSDQIVAEATALYKKAIELNDAKFFDAFIKSISVLTGLSVDKLFDPDDFKTAMENFHRNVNDINGLLERSKINVVKNGVENDDTVRPTINENGNKEGTPLVT